MFVAFILLFIYAGSVALLLFPIRSHFHHVGKSGKLLPHSHWRHNRGVSSEFPESFFLQNKSLGYDVIFVGWIFHINLHYLMLHYITVLTAYNLSMSKGKQDHNILYIGAILDC